jgi:hypothetical protein
MGQINCSLRSLLTWLAASSLLAAGCVSTDDVSGAPDEGAPDLTTGEFAGHTAPSLGPVGQWEWHDVPGAVCGYGQQTGFAVNVGTGSDVMIYLEGGGLCFDEITCAAMLPSTPITGGATALASYFTDGFTAATFAQILAQGGYSTGIFDRTLPNNPFQDSTLIYIPYCTGDLHTGSTTQWFFLNQRTAHFAGLQDLDLFLAMIVPAFPDASRVTLTGTSAGGFGSVLTYAHVSEAFGDKRVDLVTDSGPLLWIDPVVSLGFPVWNTNALIPADCPQCLQNYTHLYSYLSTKYPASRFALLSHDQDLVISVGYLMLPFPEFYLTMNDFTRHTIGPNPNWKYFVAGGTGHGFLYNLRESSTEQVLHCNWQFGLCVPYWVPVTTVLADWLTQLVTDDPGWQSVSSIL